MFGRERIEYKTREQISLMRRAGLVVADIHAAVRAAAVPGVTTKALDAVAAEVIRSAGATPNFLGYHGFTGVICTSVNDEVVHGIPGDRVLEAGDVLSVDAGAIVSGWHGDAAFSMVVGASPATPDVADPADIAMIKVAEEAMWAGIAALAGAKFLGEASAAIEQSILSAGQYGILTDYTGHGIGSAMHQAPDVPNYAAGRGPRVRPGMCLAIEPMITRGSADVDVAEDEWTVFTVDGSRAAHVEHTVAVHDGGLWVLTSPDGGSAGLAPFGVEPVPLPT